jgi:hypothetical protein
MNDKDRMTERMVALETSLAEERAKNRRLEAQHEKLLEEIGGLVVEKAELQKQILDMRNCGNCGNYDPAGIYKFCLECYADRIGHEKNLWKPKEDSTHEKSQG